MNWVKLASAFYDRSDLAAEYYDEHVFDGKTYGDLFARKVPLIVINATDMVHGARVSFIQDTFDVICSDLSTFPVARACAASSAVPMVLSPITLRNYAGQCGFHMPKEIEETITAQIEAQEGKTANGIILVQGGRFGGYGLFLSKGVAGIRQGKPVFLYNLLNLKRTTWSGPELSAGKHTIVFNFKSDGPELGKGGTGVLYVDGKEVDRNSMEHTMPITLPEDETFDIGEDTRTGVAMLKYRYDVPFKFTGKIDQLTFKLNPFEIEPNAGSKSRAELAPIEAPDPDPMEATEQR